MAALAATVFPLLTATAQADVMSAGTWEGQVTGGTLSLGDGDYDNPTPIAVPGGAKFTFTIPTGAGGPVAWTAPATNVDIPVRSVTDSGTVYSAGGTIDISALDGTVDPATGAATATGSAHGVFHLNTYTASSSSGSSIYCYFGDPAAPPSNPQTPAPAALSLAGTGSLTDAVFAATVDCADAIPPGFDNLRIIGHTTMPSGANTLALTTTFTRKPDPAPANPVNHPTKTSTGTTTTKGTPLPVQCVVPKLKGMRLAKARKAVKKAHCAVGKVKRKMSSRKRTVVLKQGEKAGAILVEGSTIALTVAK